MKETLLSQCERNFVNKCIEAETRLDGRQLLESRQVQIHFGSNWGSCVVSLGQTKVAVQVSCDIQVPKASRPNEGMVHINVELNPIAAAHFENGRPSEASAVINRQLEKCFKESKCIDLESLCIVADKKVWNIRVDINIINHDGNLVDCASIGALAALSHFHRPDVTSTGEEIIVHPFTEKDPLPLTLYHYPVCVSFVTFENGKTVFDPTFLEERVSVSQLTFGINSYQEVCSMHFDYTAYTSLIVDVVPTVSSFAATYAAELIKQIKDATKHDVELRYKKEIPDVNRLQHAISCDKVTSMYSNRINIKLSNWKAMEQEEAVNRTDEPMEDAALENAKIVEVGEGTADLIQDQGKMIGQGGQNTWHSFDTSDEEDEIEYVSATSTKKVLDNIELSGDSEEETTTTVSKADLS